ncbi:type 2 DNA topoisomerase 6 subunit B-like isoform X2 [Stigmatopora argus]
MLELIKQALRLLLHLGNKGHPKGEVLVLLWAESGAVNCTVAAAGPKWRKIRPETLQNVLRDLKFPCAETPPEPAQPDLCAFSDEHGSLKFLLSFQAKDFRCFSPEWPARVKAFLTIFSLANAAIRVHLRCKFPQHTILEKFCAHFTRRLTLPMKQSLMLDVTCSFLASTLVKDGSWCPGGHPTLGSLLPISIPPETMDRGLYGELSMQSVALLSPCLLQYPNLRTILTQVLAYTPSNVPMTFRFAFFRNLPAHPDCQELLPRVLHWPSNIDPLDEGRIVYTVEDGTCQELEKEFHLQPVEQKLLIFLLFQHTDPFESQLMDTMVTEALIEHQLDEILNNNRRAITGALLTEISNTLKAQDRRKKDQEKLLSAAEVILSSSISIINCSTNLTFRKECMSRMQVSDTSALAVSLRETLLRVVSQRCVPRKKCYSAQLEEHLQSAEDTREEI